MEDRASRREVVAVDIGGTHARFAIATLAGSRVVALDHVEKLMTSDYAGLEGAWEAYDALLDRPIPLEAGVAIAGPADLPVLKLTNNTWVIDKAQAAARLGLARLLFVNDFGAIGHATAQLGSTGLCHVAGPDHGLPEQGVVSIVGPGTGLGVAMLLTGAQPRVIETEGGHVGFASTDKVQDAVLAWLHTRHKRVSVERIVSGPGLLAIMAALAGLEGLPEPAMADKDAWAAALDGTDDLAVRALDIFCRCFGSACGDFVLAQGAAALVLAGGITERIGDRLATSAFWRCFTAKGRFEERMAAIPVRRITHPQPGLLGAAAALAAAI